MPHGKNGNALPPVSGADLIGDLPDSILHHVLSFLPAQEAVQTSVLARRWRHLWRYTTGLCIIGGLDYDKDFKFQHLRKFVEHLLILRERTDLDTVEIKLGESIPLNDDVEHCVNLWIRFAAMCKVRVLSLHNCNIDLYLDDLPLVARNLRTLDLHAVTLHETFLDFASCPVLEDLKMKDCNIRAGKLSSRSLKHLSMTDCWFRINRRLHVCTPGLISLNLVWFVGRTPFLENMTLLESACVEFDEDCNDVCLDYDYGVFCGDNNNACNNCVPIEEDCNRDCVLLGGISSAKHLKLLSETGKGPDHKVEMKGRYTSMEGLFAISEHLNIVEVKCDVVNETILKVLKFLSAINICFSYE